jgi:alpha/beta superfamily hydrolase
MTASVHPVVFPNAAGHRLFGILHQPAINRNPGVAIVLLSPGIKGRVAPHRLYVKMARRLCDAGFMVLRFDFYGLGDAEGELDEKLVADVYGAVSVGRYVEDTIAAMDWLQHEHQVGKFVLSGLCGGAITGLFAGARDARVDALIGLAIPVIQYGDNSMRYRYLSAGEQGQFRRGYLRKLLDWRSWVRLLTFRSDYSVIAKVFLSPLKRMWQRKVPATAETPAAGEAGDAADTGNLNTYFPPAFFGMLGASRKLYLIFGATDRLYWDFDEKFYQQRKHEIERFPGRFELHLVKEARHIFEEPEHQEDLFCSILAWVRREYDSGSTRTAA